jgi:predicted  nucleic acid-binding Zn-ribbon protein
MRAVITTTTLIGALLTIASAASAAPTIFPRPGNRLAQVNNPTASTILADSQDPSTLYVMPPSAGKASLANTTYSANVGFCAEMRDLQQYSRNLTKRIDQTISEVETYKAELDALRRKKGEYAEQAEAVKRSSKAVSEADTLSDRIDDIAARIDELRDRRDQCGEDDATCRDEIGEELDSLRDEKRELSAELREKRREAGQSLRDYERLEGKARAVQTQIEDVFGLVDEKIKFIAKGRNQIWEMYRNFAKIEGGTASVDFDSGWNASVLAVRSANAGFHVVPIQTQDVRVAVSLVPGLGTDGYLDSLPAVLNMTINGQPLDPNNPFQTMPSVPETVTASVRLSLIGACAQRAPEAFDIEKDAQGLPVYGLAETYQYPSTFRTKVTAKVNIWNAYTYMKKVTTDGGFFSSSTRTEENESTNGDSFVKIESFDESGLSKEEVQALEDMIKLEVVQDVLRIMGVPQAARGGHLDAVAPPASGIVVLAEGVDRTCGWFSFACTGVSWVLRGLGAIFGSSTVEAEFQKNNNYWARRSYDRDAVSMRPGMVTFKR